jgi:hypothetical protein
MQTPASAHHHDLQLQGRISNTDQLQSLRRILSSTQRFVGSCRFDRQG